MKSFLLPIALLVRKFIPIKKNRIVFVSYFGRFSDSPKYIFEEIHRINPNLELVWLVEKKYFDRLPSYAKPVEYGTFKASYYYGTANFIVDNAKLYRNNDLFSNKLLAKLKYNLLNWLHNKPSQRLYSTWHGTAFKKIGRDRVDSSLLDSYSPNTTMIMGDEFTLNLMKHLMFEKGEFKLLGFPRNDILYSNEEKVKSIKEKLGLPLDKKVILFAPTFRSGNSIEDKDVQRSGINQLELIDFNKLFESLNKKFGGEWVFVCRFHYHVEKMVNWSEINEKYGSQIINGNNSDEMGEYLACTDILMTDFSSCMMDFMITRKPVLLFFPDFEHFASVERGLYRPIESMPFPSASDFETLLQKIDNFDEKQYVKDVENLEKEYNVVKDPNSAYTIAKFILKDRGLL